LFVIALVARLLFLALSGFYGQVINSDAQDYGQIAVNLLAGHGFAFGPAEPTSFRPFGYPPFLAVVYALVGGSAAGVHWTQAVLGSLAVVPTYALARHLVSRAVAVLAGLGVALHPVLLYLTALIAPETVALLAQMGLLWFAFGIGCQRSIRLIAILGFALSAAIAALMRPELLLVVWLLPLGFMVTYRSFSGAARRLVAAALLATALAIVPPVARNAVVFRAFIPMPTIGGVTFWGANNAAVSGGWVMPTPDTWPDDDPPLSMRGWAGLTEKESQAKFYAASRQWIRDHPGSALGLIPRKLLRSWTLSFADEAKASRVPANLQLANWAFGLCILAGLIVACRKHRQAVWLLLAPIVAWLVKTVVFYGSARQTALALTALIIFAAVALAAVVEAARSQLGYLAKGRGERRWGDKD
jgi:hypothetical protein